MNICIVNLSNRELSDELLNHLFNHSPPKSILLIEDIDGKKERKIQKVFYFYFIFIF